MKTAVLLLALLAAGDEVNDLNERAKAALDSGRASDAVLLLQKAVMLAPDDAVLSKNLAYAYYKRGTQQLQFYREDEAAADFRKAGEINRAEPGYRTHLANLLLRRYRLEEARAVLVPLVQDHPRSAEGWLLLGDAENLLDHLPEALEAYQNAAVFGEGELGSHARFAVERVRLQHAVEKDYLTYTTGSFLVRHPAGVKGPELSVLERARTEVCNALDVYPQGRAVVVLYPPEEFRRVTGANEWVGGLFDRKIRLPIADVEQIETAFRHEYAHLIVSEIAPACPTFVNEGLAQVLELGRGGGMARLVALLDAQRQPPRLADLPDDFVQLRDERQVALVYALSYAFVDHVLAMHGSAGIMGWVRRLANRPLADAYREATGRPLDAEEELFRELVRTAR